MKLLFRLALIILLALPMVSFGQSMQDSILLSELLKTYSNVEKGDALVKFYNVKLNDLRTQYDKLLSQFIYQDYQWSEDMKKAKEEEFLNIQDKMKHLENEANEAVEKLRKQQLIEPTPPGGH